MESIDDVVYHEDTQTRRATQLSRLLGVIEMLKSPELYDRAEVIDRLIAMAMAYEQEFMG